MIIGSQMDTYGSVTLRVYKMESNGPVRVRLFPFVHSQSYRPIKVNLVPNYHLAGSPLELSQVPLGVPGPQFGNHCSKGHMINIHVVHLVSERHCTLNYTHRPTFVSGIKYLKIKSQKIARHSPAFP